MEKKLPGVYAVLITKKMTNNKEVFRSKEEVLAEEKVAIEEIKEIFRAKNHVYKTKVLIRTKMGVREVELVGIMGNYLLTLKGEKIDMGEILAIKKV